MTRSVTYKIAPALVGVALAVAVAGMASADEGATDFAYDPSATEAQREETEQVATELVATELTANEPAADKQAATGENAVQTAEPATPEAGEKGSDPAAAAQKLAAQKKTPPPYLLSADEVNYDPQAKIVEARGHVEVWRGDRGLLADELTYDENQGRAKARGNVTLFEPTGEVIFADEVDLTGDLREGAIEDVRAILADGARIAAASGHRENGVVTELNKTVYSPCADCPTDPDAPLLWQIKAVKVRHNQEKKIVEFEQATLEVADVPVFYVPYFYMPDPTVKRKTGLLAPTFGNSSDLGFLIRQPVFWAIAPNQDATITPWMTSQEGPVLQGQYRLALENGGGQVGGAVTYDSRQRTRGTITGKFGYDIDDTWRAGFDVSRTTDRTFRRRYNFGDERSLITQPYAEGFWSNTYFSASGLAFQRLDDNSEQDEIPFVAPLVNMNYVGDVDSWGGRSNLALNGAAFTRDSGLDTQRISARGGWERPLLGPLGDVFTFSGQVWADGYNVQNGSTSQGETGYSGETGRVVPMMGAEWRLPMIRQGETTQQVIEPIVEVIAAPNYGNSGRIPNEDSQDVELLHTNVFGYQRYPGIDRIEEGPRANYGMQWTMYMPEHTRASAFVGQAYRVYENSNYPSGSGLEDNFSDVVGVVDLTPDQYLDLMYRTRVDKDEFKFRRHELASRIGGDALSLETGYVLLSNERGSDLGDREEIQLKLTSQLTRYWRGSVFGTRDLTNGGSQRLIGTTVFYEDECFIVGFEFRRKNQKDKDIEPSNIFLVHIVLKTLGGTGTGFSQSG